MVFVIAAWFIVAAFFVGVPGYYFIHMKNLSRKPWVLNIDKNYTPSVAILVPVHNEEKTIRLKMENLGKVQYLAEKMEVVIVNDASEDGTLAELELYTANNPLMKIKVFDSKEHLGKTDCLNRALKSINADVVVISDADCFWASDILQKALPYLSDPMVGAITAKEELLNPKGSWVTLGEEFYDNTVQSIRVGESKVHSTLFFQGGFAAYKRDRLFEFDQGADDSGTALDLIQKNNRTLLIPEISFFTTFPTIWKNKINLKIRRASQLQHLWSKCLNLLIRGKLVIPKKIAIPEIFMHIFNPLLLVVLSVLSIVAFVQYPLFFFAFLLILCPILLLKRTRTTLTEALQTNFILLIALTSFINNKGFKLWKTVQESRSLLTEDLLKEYHLV